MSTSHYPRFTAKPPSDREIGFTIAGVYGPQHAQAGEEWAETFECLSDLPAVMISEGRLAYRIADNKALIQATPAARFIASAVVAEQKAAFDELIHDTNRLIDSEVIGDVFEYLFEVYGNRPTEPVAASPNGRPGTGATSEEG